MWTGKKICWLRWGQLNVPVCFIDVCDSILVALGKIPSKNQSINTIQFWSTIRCRIWLELTSFARLRCETSNRFQWISTLHTIHWYEWNNIHVIIVLIFPVEKWAITVLLAGCILCSVCWPVHEYFEASKHSASLMIVAKKNKGTAKVYKSLWIHYISTYVYRKKFLMS